MRKTTTYLLALLVIAFAWPMVGCHHHHKEKRSVTIEGPESKTEVEISKEKKDH